MSHLTFELEFNEIEWTFTESGEDTVEDMLRCSGCKEWAHSLCVGQVSEDFICDFCRNKYT